MKKLLPIYLALLCFVATAFPQSAVNVIFSNSGTPTAVSDVHPLPVTSSGGGGAVTIADGADVTLGAIADASIAAGATGTISAKLRKLSADIATIVTNTTGLATSANQTTANTSLSTIATNTALGTAVPASSSSVVQATATTVASTVLEASHVGKASAGSLVSLQALNTKASAQYILVMNSATVPGDGAVTLLCPPIYMPATSNMMLNFTTPLTASTGISVCNSSTGSFTKTVGSADCIFTIQVQ